MYESLRGYVRSGKGACVKRAANLNMPQSAMDFEAMRSRSLLLFLRLFLF